MSAQRELVSSDGTTIAYRVGGDGATVLLVHGAATSGADWFALAPILRREFRVVVLDRRGRGRSGDGTEYSMAREANDLAALVEREEVDYVVAHSYGALCTILAAPSLARVRKLVLYEPPIAYDGAGLDHLEELVEQGRLDEVLHAFLAGAGTSSDQLAAIRASPAWPVLLDAVPVLPRELRACSEWKNPAGPITPPTQFLVGAETRSAVYLSGLEELTAAFTDIQRVEIAGQQHVAHVFAAETFSEPVAEFCRE